RSTLTSRAEADISREFVFHNSKAKYRGIPIIAANMDTTGTMEMARVLGKHSLSVALHKHYPESELIAFFRSTEKNGLAPSAAFYSMGIGKADRDKFDAVMKQAGNAIRYVCIDVANGYTEGFIHFVKKIRDAHP